MINPWQCYACRDEYTHFRHSTSQMVCSRGDSAQLPRRLRTIMPSMMWRHKCWWNSWLFWTQELMNSMMFFVINREYVRAISSKKRTSSIDTLQLTDQLWLILLVSVCVLQVRYFALACRWKLVFVFTKNVEISSNSPKKYQGMFCYILPPINTQKRKWN